jgi:hypothetical protein
MAAAFTLASLILSIDAAHAEVQDDLSVDQLVDYADEVVIGEVTANTSAWQGKKILTTSTVRVDEALKGAPEAEVEVVQFGGTAVHPVLGKPMRMDVSGFASFRVGEHVLLFLQRPEGPESAAQTAPRRPAAQDAREEAHRAARAEAHRALGERRRLVAGQLGRFTVKGDPSDRDASLPVGPKRLKMVRDGQSPRLEAEEIRLSDMKERIRKRVAAGRKAREFEGPKGGSAR